MSRGVCEEHDLATGVVVGTAFEAALRSTFEGNFCLGEMRVKS